MSWTIRLERHVDIVESFFVDVVLAGPDDVERWEREIGALLTPGAPHRLLIDLDGLVVKPAAAGAFGEARARVLARYARCSARYGGDGWTRMSIHTSAIRQNTHGEVFETRDEALRYLRSF